MHGIEYAWGVVFIAVNACVYEPVLLHGESWSTFSGTNG